MVYMWTVQRLEYEGNDVQLFCRTSDRRNVKITWFDRTDSKIVNDSNYKVTANSIAFRCYFSCLVLCDTLQSRLLPAVE